MTERPLPRRAAMSALLALFAIAATACAEHTAVANGDTTMPRAAPAPETASQVVAPVARTIVREDTPVCLGKNSRASFRLDTAGKPADMNKAPAWLRKFIPRLKVRGHGSGVVLTTSGLILTSAHVVVHEGKTAELTITVIADGHRKPVTVKAHVVAVNEQFDLALVKADTTFTDTVVLANPDELIMGMTVYNVGYPYDFGEMVGRGYVQRLHYKSDMGKPNFDDIMLAQLPDGPGTSGSGVYSEATGKLIGIMMAYLSRTDDGSGAMWITRAVVPIARVREFLDEHGAQYEATPTGTVVCAP